jgi:hypothetical protein
MNCGEGELDMSFDFNKKGQTYEFAAFEDDKGNFGVLSEAASKYFWQLQSAISKTHQQGDEAQKRLMIGAQGCLERLEAFVVQSNRMRLHHKSVCSQPSPPPGSMVAFRDTIAVFDFEALLFHSRALLDRITFFITKQIYNQVCDKPTKMRNVLNNFMKKDERVSRALQVIGEAMPSLYGLIIDTESGEKSLRSHLIHKSTSGENSTCTFTIHSAPGNKAIRFDFEVKGNPIIGSAWKLSKYVPFLALNLLGIYLNLEDGVTLDQCTPIWKNELKCFTQLIDESESGPEFTMMKMNPSGIEINTRHLKEGVLS